MQKSALVLSVLAVLVSLAGCASDSSVNDAGAADGAPVIERFDVEPGGGLKAGGGEVTLSWAVTGADRVRIDPDLGTVDGTERVTTVTQSTVFTLTASNAKGSTERAAIALVASDQPPAVDFLALTAADQIDEALALGTIDDVTALRYKVFALHGDERLPSEYDADGPIHGTPIMIELAERFDSLPADVQEEMRPFLLRPDLPESWYAIQSRSTQKADGSDADAQPPFEGDLLVADGRVSVQWQASFADGEKEFVRTVIGQALTHSYAELTELMGRFPIGDGEDPDVYPVYVISGGSSSPGIGWVAPTSEAPRGWKSHLTLDLVRLLSRITSNPELDLLPSELMSWVIAHELFHAIGVAFDLDDIASNAVHWLHESSATWAGDYVYPEFDYQHRFTAEFLGAPNRPLDDLSGKREYGSYLFHLFVTQRLGGPSMIRRIWEECESQDVLPAIDKALGGKLTEVWADVAVTNWNAGPVRQFEDWDDVEEGVSTFADAFTSVDVALDGQEDVITALPIADPGVRSLAAQYYHLKFEDPNVRTLLFSNGFNYELGRGVPSDLIVEHDGDAFYVTNEVFTEVRARKTPTRLLVKSQGQWQGPYDLTLVPFVAFCQDLSEERVEELVIVFSNGNFEAGKRSPVLPRAIEPSFLVSNMACGAWGGSAGGTEMATPAPGNPDFELSEVTQISGNNLVFSREGTPMEELVKGLPPTNLGNYLFSAYVWPSYSFTLSEADVGWTETYFQRDPGQSCEGSGGTSLDETGLYGIMGTYNHALSGDPSYRRHYVDIGSLLELSYQVTCTFGPGGTRNKSFSFGTIGDEILPIEHNGTTIHARAEREAEGGVAIYTEDWSWDLTAVAE